MQFSREAAQIDLWARELMPTHELRKRFHDRPDQHAGFANRYRLELSERLDNIIELFASIDSTPLSLVTATKDLDRGHVAVLKAFLEAHLA